MICCSGCSLTLSLLTATMKKLQLAGCVRLQGQLLPLARLGCLEKLDLEACAGLEGSLTPLVDLEKLRILNVCDTALTGSEDFRTQHQGVQCSVGRQDIVFRTAFEFILLDIGAYIGLPAVHLKDMR